MAPFCFKGGESVAEYDGEIRINTRIDTNGIIQGMSEIRQIIERNMSASKPMRNTEQEVKMLGDSFSETAKKASDLQPKMDLKKDARVPTKEYSDLQKEFDSLQKKLLSVYNSQERFLATGGKEESSTYKKMIYDADTLEKKLQSIERAMESLVKSGKAFTFGKDSDAEYMERAKENIERVLDRMEERKKKQAQTSPELLKPKYGKPIDYEAMREAEKEIQNFIDAYVSGGKNAQEFAEKSNEAIASIAQKLSELKSRQKELEKSGIGLGFKEYDENVQKIAEINNALKDYRRGLTDTESSHERLKRSLNDLSERMTAILKPAQVFKQAFSSNGVDVSGYGRLGSAWGELKGKAIGLASTIKQVFETIKNEPTSALSAIGHFPSTFGNILISGFSVAANKVMDILSGTIGKIPNLVVDAASKTGNAFGSLTEAAKEKLAGLGGIILTSILHPFQTIKSVASSTMNGLGAVLKSSLTPALESIKEKAAGVATSIINGISHPFQTMKNIAVSAIGNTSKLLSGMISTAKNVGKAISNISSMLKKASSAMSIFGKSTKSSNNMLQSGFKNLLKYGLGIRSMYVLINKFRTAVKEGFKNLAQYSEPVNMALSSLKSSLLQLKNSLATAFAPILTAIAPALTFFINMVSKAVTYIGMLIAALTGQKTFTKAVAVQEDYAASLGKTASNAKKADKEQKKQLSSLDRLNNLTSPDEGSGNGSGDGGGGSGINPGDMFETVDIPSQISGLADMIKKAWAEADFTEIGALIGTKLKEALDNIPWAGIQESAAKIGKSLATFINGFISVEGLPETIGKNIGEAINTGIIGINSFLDNTKWEEVGKFLGKGANSVVNTIDWEGLGHLFAAKFNAVFKTLGAFAEEFDWSNFGTKVGTGVTKAISDFDWSTAGSSLGKTISGLFQTLKSFIDNTDWKELGKGITTAISSFLGNIDWGTVGGTISSFAIGILNFLTGLIEGIEWSEVPQAIIDGISDFFSGFDYEGVFSSVGEFIGSAVAAGIDLINAIGKILGDVATNVKNYFVEKFKEAGWDKDNGFLENGKAIVLGLLNGILEAIKGIGRWIKKNIFDPFIKGFKKAFGIASPSKVMKNQGEFIMQGLINGISSLVGSVVEKFNFIKDKVVGAWDKAKEKTSEIWNNIKQKVSDTWNNMKTNASEKFSKMKKSVVDAWNKAKEKTGEIWEGAKGIASSLKTKWEDMKKAASEKFSDIRKSVVDAWDKAKEKTSNIWEGAKGIAASVKEKWKGMKESAENRFSDMKESVMDAWDKAKEKTSNIWEGAQGIAESLKSKWEDMKTNASSKFVDMKDAISRAWDELKTNTENTWENIKNVIKTPINAIIGFINSFIRGVANGINSLIELLNKFKIDIPKGVPLVGGQKIGFNLSKISAPQIPLLATGAVIPANREFLAVLGDQKHGRNLEAPENLIRQIVREETASNTFGGEITIKIPVEVDGRVLFELMKKLDLEQYKRTGKPSFQI